MPSLSQRVSPSVTVQSLSGTSLGIEASNTVNSFIEPSWPQGSRFPPVNGFQHEQQTQLRNFLTSGNRPGTAPSVAANVGHNAMGMQQGSLRSDCRHVHARKLASKRNLESLAEEWHHLLVNLDPAQPHYRDTPITTDMDPFTVAYALLLIKEGVTNQQALSLPGRVAKLHSDCQCCQEAQKLNISLLEYLITGAISCMRVRSSRRGLVPTMPQFYGMTQDTRYSMLATVYGKRPETSWHPPPASPRPVTPPPPVLYHVDTQTDSLEVPIAHVSTQSEHPDFSTAGTQYEPPVEEPEESSFSVGDLLKGLGLPESLEPFKVALFALASGKALAEFQTLSAHVKAEIQDSMSRTAVLPLSMAVQDVESDGLLPHGEIGAAGYLGGDDIWASMVGQMEGLVNSLQGRIGLKGDMLAVPSASYIVETASEGLTDDTSYSLLVEGSLVPDWLSLLQDNAPSASYDLPEDLLAASVVYLQQSLSSSHFNQPPEVTSAPASVPTTPSKASTSHGIPSLITSLMSFLPLSKHLKKDGREFFHCFYHSTVSSLSSDEATEEQLEHFNAMAVSREASVEACSELIDTISDAVQLARQAAGSQLMAVQDGSAALVLMNQLGQALGDPPTEILKYFPTLQATLRSLEQLKEGRSPSRSCSSTLVLADLVSQLLGQLFMCSRRVLLSCRSVHSVALSGASQLGLSHGVVKVLNMRPMVEMVMRLEAMAAAVEGLLSGMEVPDTQRSSADTLQAEDDGDMPLMRCASDTSPLQQVNSSAPPSTNRTSLSSWLILPIIQGLLSTLELSFECWTTLCYQAWEVVRMQVEVEAAGLQGVLSYQELENRLKLSKEELAKAVALKASLEVSLKEAEEARRKAAMAAEAQREAAEREKIRILEEAAAKAAEAAESERVRLEAEKEREEAEAIRKRAEREKEEAAQVAELEAACRKEAEAAAAELERKRLAELHELQAALKEAERRAQEAAAEAEAARKRAEELEAALKVKPPPPIAEKKGCCG
ncbi:hypothetical protein CEUSTIGMA_g2283.t1 [Chlamydomonas eustigma]|uniref:Uncharacterized protein n=1 Tax=Chlamydomonas eustigma TaxID=1157962 RepID=A0A250WVI0_9CHLO|nr:hypothetical protein CEUSTIGMA_g2283.t1 [Chlamydomonas eustigma]|eukprot:GAX74837.1 hypothetical protein CEUSTIGMA_g2283.t1 [Chlamydomonas eustigma]